MIKLIKTGTSSDKKHSLLVLSQKGTVGLYKLLYKNRALTLT